MSKRSDTVDPLEVGYYHIWNRCVRHAWLWGKDPLTGRNYNHRRKWIERRLELQATLFAIEISFHAEMINHFHNILCTRPDVVATWSDEEVVRRILLINQLPRSFDGDLREPTPGEINIELADPEKVSQYRVRLSDPSWFMKQLNEYVSRRVNDEEGLTGRLWEGPFKCRRLEDDAAILVCGIYIDLNQIRAGEVFTPEESVHTSAYNRIQGARYIAELLDQTNPELAEQRLWQRPDGWLAELTLEQGLNVDVRDGVKPSQCSRLTDKGTLPLQLHEYLTLLDCTGRLEVSGKSGSIPDEIAPILERLHINSDNWLNTIKEFENLFGRAMGRVETLLKRAQANGKHWIRGVRNCAEAFS